MPICSSELQPVQAVLTQAGVKGFRQPLFRANWFEYGAQTRTCAHEAGRSLRSRKLLRSA